MKTIHKKTTNLSAMRSMASSHRSGSFAAYEIEKASDATKVTKEIEGFLGKELKPVTVLLLKA